MKISLWTEDKSQKAFIEFSEAEAARLVAFLTEQLSSSAAQQLVEKAVFEDLPTTKTDLKRGMCSFILMKGTS